jgi:hypothetical protein
MYGEKFLVHNGILPISNRRYLIDTNPQKWGDKLQAIKFGYGDAQQQLRRARLVFLSPGIEKVEE